eukprot:CAMPEP_0185768880 /NCGR_PEP_ID=MMETSP1174-20130828/52792_1 /TAXON_ID=35687 /ORGANISM="Dictyocha speculum, Strain CCMP1381" /LENGTH=127 /DNA_ID=CAMNT_0028453773 /DNA_START=60 /DNA_END=443 /DNA_ORIENTATION=+
MAYDPTRTRTRTTHSLMIALICSIGLIVALLLSEYAFPELQVLQQEAKIGALLSGFISLFCVALSRHYDFETVEESVNNQILEEAEELKRTHLCQVCGGYSLVLTKKSGGRAALLSDEEGEPAPAEK